MYMAMREDKHFDRDLIRSRLKDFEGVVLKAYECSQGYTSIGVGRNLDSRGITEDEAMYLLKNDIESVVKILPCGLSYIDNLCLDDGVLLSWLSSSLMKEGIDVEDDNDSSNKINN